MVATPSEAAYRVLFEALEKQVKIRETGRVTMSVGSLKFLILGRTILREKGSSGLQLFVDQDCLNSAFQEYGISKGSTAFPDLGPFLGQTLSEEPISAEAHSKSRRVLGRLSWLAQTRQDILILIAMLSTGQSCPKPGHEKALRAVLRFMLLHMKMSQKFPSPGLEDLSEKDIGLEVYSDAGFAPAQATQRRSTTGCVIVFRRVVLKCFSRHQASVTLNPCEAELVAIQAAVQEARCHNRFNEVMFTVAFCRQFPFQFHSETIWIFNFLAGRMPLNCALNTVGTFGRANQVLLR